MAAAPAFAKECLLLDWCTVGRFPLSYLALPWLSKASDGSVEVEGTLAGDEAGECMT